MRDDVANLVYPVLNHGLRLKERLSRGERPNLSAEQAALKGLLGSATQAHPWGSDGMPVASVTSSTAPARGGTFLGIRYALTCWLDEILIDSPWSAEWNEQKLEQALYASNLRYHKFWEQARLAESAPGTDALEGFLLCVLLGFRGELGEAPERLRDWVANAQTRIGATQNAGAPTIPDGRMEANVPVLPWADRYQTMVKVCSVGLLALVPVAALLLTMLLQ
jgi:type VI secretion system protein ImpK